MARVAHSLRALAARIARSETGFTLPTVMGMLLVTSSLAAAAWGVATLDLPQARKDQDRKAAYAAAEAGVNYYLFQLRQDSSYWTYCTGVPAPGPGQPSPVNQMWNGTGPDPRTWRPLPGGQAQYTIELLPQNGATSCNTASPQQSMIDGQTGMLQIRATGRSNGVKRSIVASFRPKGFLDFLYFTDLETVDPIMYQASNPQYAQWAAQNCLTYRRNGRSSTCQSIVFADTDVINGPLHTNDDIVICGTPEFGRTSADSIELSGPSWSSGCALPPAPVFRGTYKPNSPTLSLPASNGSLQSVTASNYVFTGTTTIVLNGTTMNVTNQAAGLNNTLMNLPPNGVIYVKNGTCGATYNVQQSYTNPQGCGDAWVKGSYSKGLTIAAENDIIINGSITQTSNGMLGLISNNFVRVYHRVNRSNCTNSSDSLTNPRIDAAILALQHSFIVDNYDCGPSLGTLTVNGAIAQRFRGPVGTGGSVISTGYSKNYAYDDRLKVTGPPFFISPTQAQWQPVRYTEQLPAT